MAISTAHIARKRAAFSTPSAFKDSAWLQIPFDRAHQALLLVGPEGIGKTQWALAQFEYPLHVDTATKLKTFDSDVHDGIVFEQGLYQKLDGHAIKKLVAVEDGPVFPTLGGRHVQLPQGVPLIFTGRSVEAVFSASSMQHEGVGWRLKVVHVETKMYTL